MHEAIFSVLYVLEYGINPEFKNSTTYSTEYMKKKAELASTADDAVVKKDLENTRRIFEEYQKWLLECTTITPYPISKEIYGVSSKQYKFSTAVALILTAIYKKIYIDRDVEFETFDSTICAIQNCLKNSFIEDTSYVASSTNSKEIEKLIDAFGK